MFDKLFKKLQVFGKHVDQLELNVTSERRKFMEVFERNLMLEKEVAERVHELNQANKSILTLQHIWKTMNSQDPLSEVLRTIVNGLSDDLGYLHSFILQVVNGENGKVLRVRAFAENSFSQKIENTLKAPITTYEIPMDKNSNILIKALKKKAILTTKQVSIIFEGVKPQIEASKLNELDKLLAKRSISILPIIAHEEEFGCLIVVSIRKEMSDTEKNFLKLFAGQLELAVTIAGLFETVREQAITDGLTGLYNRRYFDQCLIKEAERAIRLNQPFSLVTLDLDHLKQINDTYGHGAGDAAICTIGQVLKSNARSVDIPSRWGGEEFGIVLPGIDVEGGMIAAERLRVAIESSPVQEVGTITASIGIATFLRHTDNIDELLEMVDQAMYKAKRNGRNQVQLAQKDEKINWQQMALDTFVDILSKQKIPIDRKTSKILADKLKDMPTNDKNLDDLVFNVVDTVTTTYDPMYKSGIIKQKIDMAEKLAREYDLDEPEINKIKMAMLLYDIGNIMIPEKILLKPGPLDEDEKKKVTEHPIIGAKEILGPIGSAGSIISIVEHHHENWDGSGYPNKLAGEDIPIGSRIIIIVDAYFAMINDRPYRKALSVPEALKILKEGANVKWDGALVNTFTKLINSEIMS